MLSHTNPGFPPLKRHVNHYLETKHARRIQRSSIDKLSGLQSLVANRLELVKSEKGKKTGDARGPGFVAELDNLGIKLDEWKEELNHIKDQVRSQSVAVTIAGLEDRTEIHTFNYIRINDP